MDYFLARYYSSAQGRFTSPDEFVGGPDEFYDFADKSAVNPTSYADLSDPQSLNKYQYCYNNPLLYIDPNGHQGLREYARKIGDAAYQVGKDTVVGGAKGIYNLAVGVPNTINTVVDAVISPLTDFRFGQLPTAEPGTTGEKGAMLATDIIATVYAAKASAGGLARAEEAITGVVDSIPKRVANSDVVVRGGTQRMPPAGTTFSGAAGRTLPEAASGVPHGTIRSSTAGAIRSAGGKVRNRPELTRSGVLNKRHVNVKEGSGPSTFSEPRANPVPKKDRIQ